MRACVLTLARGRRACVFTNVLCMYVSCACVRAVCVFSQACVRVDVSYACVTVMCVLLRACVALMYRVRARRVRVVMSERARRRIVCVCAVDVFSQACVRVDVSCACVTVMCAFTNVRCIDVSCACAPCACCHERACASCACCHERACALTSRVRASYLSQEHEHFGPLVHFRPLYP